MPTMDDDFWTIYLVGITSLNSVLVASSFKCLLSRPIVQEVSKLTYIQIVVFGIWPKLHLGLDALRNQKILNGIYCTGCLIAKRTK